MYTLGLAIPGMRRMPDAASRPKAAGASAMLAYRIVKEAPMSVYPPLVISSPLLDPDYVDSEEQDEPLAGQDHRLTIDYIYHAFNTRLSGPDCFVAAELRVHRNARNLRDYKEPDVLVALDVADGIRERYIIPEEGKAPDLVIEALSPSSEENSDLDEKKTWYAKEGVREYIVVDPQGKFPTQPRLQRFRLELGPEVAAELAEADGVLRSRLIPFGLTVHDDWVRVVDLATGELVPTPKESEQRRLTAEREAREALARAWAAEAQARAAEVRASTLEAELSRLRRLLDERDSDRD
jgi:Uma2 family endonuclease